MYIDIFTEIYRIRRLQESCVFQQMSVCGQKDTWRIMLWFYCCFFILRVDPTWRKHEHEMCNRRLKPWLHRASFIRSQRAKGPLFCSLYADLGQTSASPFSKPRPLWLRPHPFLCCTFTSKEEGKDLVTSVEYGGSKLPKSQINKCFVCFYWGLKKHHKKSRNNSLGGKKIIKIKAHFSNWNSILRHL